MANNLLSKSFEIEDAKEIKVTCIATHANGHSEKTSMTATPDASGNKNTIQSRGSTITYLTRYTLLARFGLVTADEDNDGQIPKTEPKKTKPNPQPAKQTISKEALENIAQMTWEKLRGYNKKKYTLKWLEDVVRFVGASSVDNLTTDQLQALTRELEEAISKEKGDAENGKS